MGNTLTESSIKQERKYFDSGDYALSKAGKANDVTSIGTGHPSAETIPHASPLTHTISRADSISSGSPPQHTPSLASQNRNSIVGHPVDSGSNNNGGADIPNLGPSPAGIQRGSINGTPGAGLSGGIGSARSPAKESYLNRSESVDEVGMDINARQAATHMDREETISPPRQTGGIPIRR